MGHVTGRLTGGGGGHWDEAKHEANGQPEVSAALQL